MYLHSFNWFYKFKELREKGVLKQCDLKNVYLRDSPLDELPPKSNTNDLKINIDKEQETVNNYQRYILGYTGKLIYIFYSMQT